MEISGLSSGEVNKRRSLGLSNEVIDSYNSTYLQIFVRNILSLINIVIFPLLVALAFFELYREILAFSTFLIINTIVSILDEVRIKKKIDKLKSEFQISATVIRDGNLLSIPVSEIVQGDFVKAKEGEGIISDGKIISERYLQLDESILTGESNYQRKEIGEKVLSGSYVVTGECIYEVESVGKNNYLNKLGSEAVKIKELKSPVQKAADRIILFLTFAAISSGLLNLYLSIRGGASYELAVLSLTTIVALIIPQTLIFLYTLTYTISISKLFSKGILVQKGGSIEEISNVDVICFDKTGTITDNKMKIKDAKFFNIDEKVFGTFYNSVAPQLVSVNETQRNINEFFSNLNRFQIKNFDQIPFTSKLKYSLVKGDYQGKTKVIVLGAFSVIEKVLENGLRSDLQQFIEEKENEGFRVLSAVYAEFDEGSFDINDPLSFKTSKASVFIIEETLNPGIKDILSRLNDQSIKIKIISGDSKRSVERICQKIGIDSSQIMDLSEDLSDEDFQEAILEKSVFTRAKPEDKLKIINALNEKGLKTAMVGDGINDVLGLKAASVSIAMESGAKITREVSDIVLLKNDYSKIPDIFFEGDNIIFNLKLSTKIFLVKSLFAFFVGIFFTLRSEVVPLHPASTLIFSFLGSSAPSYVLVFTRQKVKLVGTFFRDVFSTVVPSALIFAVLFISFYLFILKDNYDFLNANTALVLFVLSISIIYSLYLVWEAKKIRSIILSLFVYIILFGIGTYQTLLPFSSLDPFEFNIILISVMFLFGFIILFIFLRGLKRRSFLKDFFISIISFIWIPVVLIFPFREYYSVTRIPFELFVRVFILSLIGLVLLILFNKISRRIILNR